MATMWRRTMVYLGLQDDDDLDYGGEYEAYGDYEHAEEPRDPRAPRAPRARDDYDSAAAPTPLPLSSRLKRSCSVSMPMWHCRCAMRRPATSPISSCSNTS